MTDQRAATGGHWAPTAAATAPITPSDQAEALASLSLATLTPIVAPLVAELADSRQAAEHQADRIVHLAERIAELDRENGRLTERLALMAAESPAVASTATQGSAPLQEPPADLEPSPWPWPLPPHPNGRPWRQRWRAWLAAGLVVAVAGSASCQASGSVKHAGLCASARASMDEWSTALSGQPMTSGMSWSTIRTTVEVAEKVC